MFVFRMSFGVDDDIVVDIAAIIVSVTDCFVEVDCCCGDIAVVVVVVVDAIAVGCVADVIEFAGVVVVVVATVCLEAVVV